MSKTFSYILPFVLMVTFYLWCLAPLTFWTGFSTAISVILTFLAFPFDRQIERIAEAWFSRKHFHSNIKNTQTACNWLSGMAEFYDGDLHIDLQGENTPKYRITIHKTKQIKPKQLFPEPQKKEVQ